MSRPTRPACCRGLLVSALALVVAIMLAPSAAFAAEVGDESGPAISNASVMPATLPYPGGSVEISIQVTDPDGIQYVYAEFLAGDGTAQGTQLSTAVGETYYGGVYLPANYASNPNQYDVYVTAADELGWFSGPELVGNVEVEAFPQFNEAPAISEPSVSPQQLPWNAGSVSFEASATDDIAITEVFATVSRPGALTTQIQMEPISYSRFLGVFDVPYNIGSSPQEYEVTMTAIDDIGQLTTIEAPGFTVASPRPGDRPPNPRGNGWGRGGRKG